jgi:hypothetical protein
MAKAQRSCRVDPPDLVLARLDLGYEREDLLCWL